MSLSPAIEAVTAQLKLDISLLEKLHTLAQTETLALDAGDFDGLPEIVAAKGQIISQLAESESSMESLISKATFRESAPAVAPLKERALYLIRRISDVDAKNFGRLQDVRNQAIEVSKKLQEYRKLGETYGTLI